MKTVVEPWMTQAICDLFPHLRTGLTEDTAEVMLKAAIIARHVPPACTDSLDQPSPVREVPSVATGGTIADPADPIVFHCRKCGVGMTKAEGGTVFAVCERCWEEEHPSAGAQGGQQNDDLTALRTRLEEAEALLSAASDDARGGFLKARTILVIRTFLKGGER